MARRRPLCIYHKNCLDGRGAAAVVARKVPDCEFLPMQYGMARPTVLDREVYIVDFGLPVEEMRAIRAEASVVHWIDHHVSQREVHRQLGWGVLDTSECGTSLTWKVLFGETPPPPVVAYIKDKDLWQWQLPDSRAIAAGLELAFPGDSFAGILEVDLADMARRGRPALADLAKRIEVAIRRGIAIHEPYGLTGVRGFALNCNRDLNDVGEHICLPTAAGGLGLDLAILFYFKKPITAWVHSLRSAGVGGVDCAAIAAARGGGGHPSSACYVSSTPLVDPSLLPTGAPAAPPAL